MYLFKTRLGGHIHGIFISHPLEKCDYGILLYLAKYWVIKMHHVSLTVGSVVRDEWACLTKLKICIYLILAKLVSLTSTQKVRGTG